jgi:predicted RNA binding protein YcfA (HicA-like mRNA interferase family)
MPRTPGVNDKQAIRALERASFAIVREGNHTVMVRGDRIITMGGIVRDAGLTADEFKGLL